MRLSFKSAVAGVATLAVAGVMAAVGATSAAAADPLFGPGDPNEYGTVLFYDAAGNQVFSGNGKASGDPVYAVSSAQTPVAPATKQAALFVYNPLPGVNSGNYSGIQLNANKIYPLAGSPAPVISSPNPATSASATDLSFFAASTTFQPKAGSLQDVYQIRVYVSKQVGYTATTVKIDPVSGAWSQIFPAPPASSTTTLAVSPASPATAPADITLTSTTSPAAAGTVEFFNGTVSLGAPVATDAAGKATKVLAAQPLGTYSFSAKFVPTDPTASQGSTSAASAYSVQAAPAKSTSVALTGPATVNVGDPATYKATVTPTAAAGTLQFFDGATSLGAAVVTDATGSASVTTSTLAAGNHSLTAKFVSGSPAQFADSTSPAVTTAVLAGVCTDPASKCTDPQSFTVTVPVGTLSISTPFHAANPFNLGTLALNSTATELSSGTKSFAGQDPAGKGITITDTRSGNLPWTANLQSSNFTSGTNSIAAKNLGFTAVTPTYIPGNALQTPAVSVFQNPAFGGGTPANAGLASASKFASATNGAGSVYVNGDFTLNAPTSTAPGIYNGTVTFTIS